MSAADWTPLRVHEDADLFLEAVSFTAAQTGFTPGLIEKDYFCSVVLQYLAAQPESPLVFKGGTCLAKVHADFYRLSEDLDFVIPMPLEAKRRDRRERIVEVKQAAEALSKRPPGLTWRQPLAGSNESRQYFGSIGYPSLLTGLGERIKIEVGLREPLLIPPCRQAARTALRDPVTGDAMVPDLHILSIDLREALAEKTRAALTRREPAVRDFFDLDHALGHGLLRFDDDEFIELVRLKLAVPGNEPVNVGPERLNALRGQLVTRLKSVLRERDYSGFDLERILERVLWCGRMVGEVEKG
ncbi:MAG: nucleotidyl transferase AbiEii/AbiGii toxin family protein [Candidatus Eisenbacteria sp.]|nr:nucleotidyl transferase AbiEii/AbiGii toxin family protein [Candidatus Eisenbacteria bacterium]